MLVYSNCSLTVALNVFFLFGVCSEFDIAAFVLFVGDVYIAGRQKKQWVFVTDGSISESRSEGLNDSLLAICFCSPHVDDQSDAPLNYNLAGSTVCNVLSQQSLMSLIFRSCSIWYKPKTTIVMFNTAGNLKKTNRVTGCHFCVLNLNRSEFL